MKQVIQINNKETIMRLLILLISFVVTLSLTLSCDSATGPEDPPPGRRDYVWSTTDTLKSFNWIAEKMWGNSPDDIWVIGGGGSATERIWHYDGEVWKHPVGIERVYPTHAVYGFNKNSVWVGGLEGQITFYDGSTWKESYRYNPENNYLVSIENIFGLNNNNIYAVGFYSLKGGNNYTRGFILHFDGIKWEEDYQTNYHSYYNKIIPDKGGIYYIWEIRIALANEPEYFAINKFDGNTVTNILLKNLSEMGSWAEMHKIGNQIYTVFRDGIYELQDDQLKRFLKIETPMFNYGIWGSNKNNIFISMWDGIAHYNGKNIEYIFYYPEGEVRLTGGLIFEEDVFFVSVSKYLTGNYFYHGKLINN